MTLAYIYYRFRGLIMALYGQRTLPNDLASLDLIAAIIFVIGIIVLRKWKPNPLWLWQVRDLQESSCIHLYKDSVK